MITIFITLSLVVIIHTISLVSRTYLWLLNQKWEAGPTQEFRVYESRPEYIRLTPVKYIADPLIGGKKFVEERRERIERDSAWALSQRLRELGLIEFRHFRDRSSVMPYGEYMMTTQIIVHKPEPRNDGDEQFMY